VLKQQVSDLQRAVELNYKRIEALQAHLDHLSGKWRP
jgi:hypothetical protein